MGEQIRRERYMPWDAPTLLSGLPFVVPAEKGMHFNEGTSRPEQRPKFPLRSGQDASLTN